MEVIPAQKKPIIQPLKLLLMMVGFKIDILLLKFVHFKKVVVVYQRIEALESVVKVISRYVLVLLKDVSSFICHEEVADETNEHYVKAY